MCSHNHAFPGLAAFSRKSEKDPWNSEWKDPLESMRGNQGQLCANFEGGTHEYFSPQQLWWLVESKKVEGEALRAFDEKYLLTPAVSDLYQAGITCLEMYACFLPSVTVNAPSAPKDAAARCAARTPDSEFVKFSPERTAGWLSEKKIEPPLDESMLVAKGLDGARMLKLARSNSHKELMKECEITKMAVAKRLQMAILHNLSSPANAMSRERVKTRDENGDAGDDDSMTVGEVLCKCLDPAVAERFNSAFDLLCGCFDLAAGKLLGGLGATWDFDETKKSLLKDVSTAVGGELLQASAVAELQDHTGAIVNATLGGLTKRLVECGDVRGASLSCAEWMGVAPPDTRPSVALSVFCKLRKDVAGNKLPRDELDLSRIARGHWREDMLSGEGVTVRQSELVAK